MPPYLIFLSLLMIINPGDAGKIDGAWIRNENNIQTVLLFSDGYFTRTRHDASKFLESSGGTYILKDGNLIVKEEFNTSSMELKTIHSPLILNPDEILLGQCREKFTRIDNGESTLNGVWVISKRMQDGLLTTIHQKGTRKTLKILTGTRFQWVAIDPAVNDFYGTGGGTFTFGDGKYVENIEFFSRDSSRVGTSLKFDDHLASGEWHHSGLSSKGDKIYEVWKRIER